jgi:hypothetical protein
MVCPAGGLVRIRRPPERKRSLVGMDRRVGFALFWLLTLSGGAALADEPGIDFFERKIRPVLTEHCFKCHSSADVKKQKGGLALDSKAGVLEGGDSGPAIVPRKPNESLLIKAVRYRDLELRMPPKGKLPAEVIADLEKWVALGAPDPRTGKVAKDNYGPTVEEGRKFWAFQPPRKHPVPEVKDAAWARGTIDRFLLAALESKGLKPADDADRVNLIRRAYFGLIGLPPTPAQIDAFVNDQSPEAFAKVVEELLASPHYGERWGRHWLDVARFAESTGGGRSLILKDAWRYRDYVIDAFNRDKPYDRFITEQVAGDLLEHRTSEQRFWQMIATAFLLLGPTNYERQDKPVLEMDIIDEQLDTIGKAFLGMTLGCARCHDHKFDPIPTKDYYALAGILKSTKWIEHANVSRWTERPLPMSPQQEVVVKQHDAAVAALKSRIEQAKAAERKAGLLVADAAKGAVEPRTLPGIVIDDSQAKKVGSWKHSKFSGNFVGDGYVYDDRAFKMDKTLTFVPDIPKSGYYEVRLAYVPYENRATNVPVRIFHTDGDDTVHVNQRQTPAIDGRFVSLGRYRFEQGNQWFVMVFTEKANGHVTADAVQFLLDGTDDDAKPPPKAVIKGGKPAQESKTLEAELKRLLVAAPERPLAMAVSEADKIENCHVCVRGNFHNRGDNVPRGFLQVAMPPGANGSGSPWHIPEKESGRKQLADWLTSPDNPLTARIMVNRIWHHLFGSGLVRTVDNFGRTGETPSHPELLDYLALRFIEEGWSVKKLIREIMLSRAYQMASVSTAERAQLGQKEDPENRLLWRMNRRRLDAESIRDAILSVSGSLDARMGGTLLKKGLAAERDQSFDDTRRSVYTPVLRNKLLELFEVFDIADPNVCMGRRNVSTVAPQALYLMNSPFVMDQAKRAAERLLAEPGLDNAGRVDRAYRTALGRLPNARERQLALAFIDQAAPAQRAQAWERFYQTLFACIDFRYVN